MKLHVFLNYVLMPSFWTCTGIFVCYCYFSVLFAFDILEKFLKTSTLVRQLGLGIYCILWKYLELGIFTNYTCCLPLTWKLAQRTMMYPMSDYNYVLAGSVIMQPQRL